MLILGQMKLLRVLVNSLLGGLFFSFLLRHPGGRPQPQPEPAQMTGRRLPGSLTLNLAVVYGLLLSVSASPGMSSASSFSARDHAPPSISPSFLSLELFASYPFLPGDIPGERALFHLLLRARGTGLARRPDHPAAGRARSSGCFVTWDSGASGKPVFWAYFLVFFAGLALVLVQKVAFSPGPGALGHDAASSENRPKRRSRSSGSTV